MPGAVMQLASQGPADVYLTGKPQVTYFKLTWRRHTNFATEAVQQAFDGIVDFGKQPTVTVSKNGDLLGAVWLQITLPDLLGYDITPTPPEGNTSNVLSLAATADGVYADDLGNYWQTRSGSPGGYAYANVVALADGVGNYYSSGTPGNVASLTGNIVTWPYMVAAGSAGSRTFSQPTTGLRYVNGVGLALIKSVELNVGGQRIDKHYSEWWDVWSELSETAEKRDGYARMVGKYAPADYATWQREHAAARTLYVPLTFCFNRTPGLYLPLAALSYSQVRFNFELRPYLECVKASVPIAALTSKAGGAPLSLGGLTMYADYVWLDAPERTRLSEMEHEYLVTQLQFQGDEPLTSPTDPNGTTNRKLTLNFIHPVKELVWVYQAASRYDVDAQTGNDIFNYEVPATANVGGSTEVFESCKLIFNGGDRFGARPGSYFRMVQPYERHTRVPDKSIYVYSFALEPEKPQPSGTANFSRYDSAQMALTLNAGLPAGRVKFFATNYNIMRVASGMAALAYTS